LHFLGVSNSCLENELTRADPSWRNAKPCSNNKAHLRWFQIV
jgi:hypothetical protein